MKGKRKGNVERCEGCARGNEGEGVRQERENMGGQVWVRKERESKRRMKEKERRG